MENFKHFLLILGFLALGILLQTRLLINFDWTHELAQSANSIFSLSSQNAIPEKQSVFQNDSGFKLEGQPEIIPNFHLKNYVDVPKIQAQTALVTDLSTRKRYFTLNIYRVWPMASLTKLMTAHLALKDFQIDDKIEISTSSLANQDTHDLKIGDIYSVFNLLKMALLVSSNDAAQSLAQALGQDKFVSEMNDEAKRMELWQTSFEEPTGLSPNNESSAADLEKMVFNIYRDSPLIFKLTKEKEAIITNLKTGTVSSIKSINLFAGEPDFLGGKTGYTDEANGNLVSLFSYESRPILVVVMGTSDRFGETRKLINWFEESYAL